MTPEAARSAVLDCLVDIAPDVPRAAVHGSTDLRRELDLDSMDLLDLVTAVSERTGHTISDRDAARLDTLDSWVSLLAGTPA